MSNILRKIGLWLLRISPYIIEFLKPWLARQADILWKEAFPLAVQIVRDLAKEPLTGWEKHSGAVAILRTRLLNSAKFTEDDLRTSDLQGIVLAAYRKEIAP